MIWERFISENGPFSVLLPFRSRARRHLEAADRARDIKNWSLAALEYGKVLDIIPQQPPIWIQLGHARKEMGDLSGGEAAYRKALELAPADSDGALHMGHVLKIQGRADEALEWYKKSLVFDPRNSEAARELRELSVDPIDFLRESYFSAIVEHQWQQSSATSFVLIDITNAWLAAGDLGPMERDATWFFEFALGLRQAVPEALFCVRLPGARMYSCLTDAAARWLRDSLFSERRMSKPNRLLRALPDAERLLLLAMPPLEADVEQWVHCLQSLREQKRVAMVAAVPTLHFLWRRELYQQHEADTAGRRIFPLLEQASVVITTSNDDADCAMKICREFGRETPAIRLSGLTSGLAVRSGAALPRASLKFAALAPRDKRELACMLSAWSAGPAGSTLSLVATHADTESIEALQASVSNAGIEATAFEVVPPVTKPVRQLLGKCRSLLVPDSRPDGIFWIEDALEIGVPVIAGQSPSIFRWFGGAIRDYCDFDQVDQLVTRWVRSELPTGPHYRRKDLIAAHREGAAAAIDAVRRMAVPEIAVGAPSIELGNYYLLAKDAPDNMEGVRDGRALVAGSHWQAPSTTGTAFKRVGCLQFLSKSFYNHFRYACLMAGNPGTSIDILVESVDRQAIGKSLWTIPKEGWGWLSGEFTVSKSAGTRINMTAKNASPANTEDPIVTVAGLLVYPASVDRYWFEFLERASRDSPSLPIDIRKHALLP